MGVRVVVGMRVERCGCTGCGSGRMGGVEGWVDAGEAVVDSGEVEVV